MRDVFQKSHRDLNTFDLITTCNPQRNRRHTELLGGANAISVFAIQGTHSHTQGFVVSLRSAGNKVSQKQVDYRSQHMGRNRSADGEGKEAFLNL